MAQDQQQSNSKNTENKEQKPNASKQKIWDILTKPEFVKLWQYGSELQTSWEIGTTIKFRTEWQGKVLSNGRFCCIYINRI